MARIKFLTVLTFLFLACLVYFTETSEQTEHEITKQHHRQQQAHWNQKHQRQHGNYKKQIQHQRQQVTYNRRQPSSYYYQKKGKPVYHYKKKYKKRKYKYIKWPRIRGRCKYSPWSVDGKNPVMEEAAKGNMVLLFMLKADDPFSYKQLFKMNDMAEHYDSIGRKITLMALAHRSRQIPAGYRKRFPLVKFYQEPASEDIYSMLRANYQYNIIYDKCGRQQYHFSSPYSWLGYDITRLAIENVRRFHTDYNLCGVCKPPPTTAQPASTNSNATSSSLTTTRPPPVTKNSQKPIDGPYTNIPVAAKH